MTRVLRLDEAQYAATLARMKRLGREIGDQATLPSPKPQKARGGPKKAVSGGSEGEVCLAFQLVGVPGWEREYRFAPPRRFRFDFAWPYRKLGVEIEGGQWTQGRHTRGRGFEGDMEKYNQATILGWAVLRFTTEQAKNGYAYRTIMEFLK